MTFDWYEDVEAAEIPPHLRQHCRYIDNTAYCSTRDFDDDFAPVGCRVRRQLVKLGLCLEDDVNEIIIITMAVRKALGQ
jgi:hypothetical protein